jgi:murein DD-endopeptidase MepM/ murein hydrolase activator NlpD
MRWLALALVALLCACSRSDSGAPVVHGTKSASASSAGHEIVVRNGDTLSRIAKDQSIELKALIDANRIAAPYRIYPGQRLVVPRSAVAREAPRPPEAVAVTVSRSPYLASDAAPLTFPAASYTTSAGQPQGHPSQGQPQLARLAEPVTVTVSRSAYDSSFVSGGPTMAAAPGPSLASAAAAKIEAHPLDPAPAFPEPPSVPSIAPAPAPLAAEAPPDTAPSPPEPGAAPDRLASLMTPRAVPPPDLGPPPPRTSQRFLWPVKGQVIVAFGPRNGGLHNDGINIRAARGTTVKAAENGVVAYVGNELRGFGNLLLIKHADGWMSAYAHNDAILVKTGDRVRRGQAISRVGSTGNVAHPQLHFELRRGSRAVDPLRYLGEGEA